MSDDSPSRAALDWACQQPAWWHESGCLGPPALDRIHHHATTPTESVRVIPRRRVRPEHGVAVQRRRASSLLHRRGGRLARKGKGCSASQLGSHDVRRWPFSAHAAEVAFSDPLDLILIDGAHGFPFAQLDYFFLYPHVRRGGILIVDDVHIPTVGQMADFLREDKMWRHLEDIGFTAFFERADSPLFDPYGDGWWEQRYNARRFADKESLEPQLGEKWWEE